VSATPVSERQGEGWQPIETAPKDGTRVLISRMDRYADLMYMYVAWCRRKSWIILESAKGTRYSVDTPPTHWMPLPAPPIHRSTGEA
jgi:hypothetical protein